MRALAGALQSNSVSVASIDLENNHIGNEGAHALVRGLQTERTSVKTISLRGNSIGDECVRGLAEAKVPISLTQRMGQAF